jgi:hypothetical protein
MLRKKIVIGYESILEEYPDSITSAKKHIAEWYKKIPQWHNDEVFDVSIGFQPTLKKCVPFLEAMTTGYMITLPYDLYVKNNNGEPYLAYKQIKEENGPKSRKRTADLNIIPAGHYPIEYTWNFCVSFVVPKGYSFLLTHPLNRNELPFTTLSGVIEGGFVTHHDGNYPFYIKQGFEGIIPQGTPLAQLIPFRNENWESKKIKGLTDKGRLNKISAGGIISGWYKKMHWQKKNYL